MEFIFGKRAWWGRLGRATISPLELYSLVIPVPGQFTEDEIVLPVGRGRFEENEAQVVWKELLIACLLRVFLYVGVDEVGAFSDILSARFQNFGTAVRAEQGTLVGFSIELYPHHFDVFLRHFNTPIFAADLIIILANSNPQPLRICNLTRMPIVAVGWCICNN